MRGQDCFVISTKDGVVSGVTLNGARLNGVLAATLDLSAPYKTTLTLTIRNPDVVMEENEFCSVKIVHAPEPQP